MLLAVGAARAVVAFIAGFLFYALAALFVALKRFCLLALYAQFLFSVPLRTANAVFFSDEGCCSNDDIYHFLI